MLSIWPLSLTVVPRGTYESSSAIALRIRFDVGKDVERGHRVEVGVAPAVREMRAIFT